MFLQKKSECRFLQTTSRHMVHARSRSSILMGGKLETHVLHPFASLGDPIPSSRHNPIQAMSI